MASKTEKKLELLENDVAVMEEKYKKLAESLRQKRIKAEETRNIAIVEIVRENKLSIDDLKTILANGIRPPEIGQISPVELAGTNEKIKKGKEIEHEENF